MIKTGLVSVTFRNLSAEKVIDLVKKSGLDAIEWGGDIHVPHGDIQCAAKVRKMTEDAGIKIASYGSYYRLGCGMDFNEVLKTAKELNAPAIRVWAGNKGSKDADDEWWNKIINESREIGDMAAKEGIKIAYEYHKKTLTDTNETALQLMQKVNHPNIYTYWQPPNDMEVSERLKGLRQVMKWVTNVHVFHWIDFKTRFALEEGKNDWNKYFEVIGQSEKEHYAMLEFVKNDDPNQFIEDAKTLKSMADFYNKR